MARESSMSSPTSVQARGTSWPSGAAWGSHSTIAMSYAASRAIHRRIHPGLDRRAHGQPGPEATAGSEAIPRRGRDG